MKVKVKFNEMPVELMNAARLELIELGYEVLTTEESNELVVIKDAKYIDGNKELAGFDIEFGISNIEYIN